MQPYLAGPRPSAQVRLGDLERHEILGSQALQSSCGKPWSWTMQQRLPVCLFRAMHRQRRKRRSASTIRSTRSTRTARRRLMRMRRSLPTAQSAPGTRARRVRQSRERLLANRVRMLLVQQKQRQLARCGMPAGKGLLVGRAAWWRRSLLNRLR